MAYMNQEKKALIKTELDKVLKPAGVKYSLGVRHHSTIVLNIKSGPVDFIGNYNSVMTPEHLHYNPHREPVTKDYIDVNTHWYKEHFTGEVLELLAKIVTALNLNNHDNSDIMTDYFDVGHYVDVNIGRYDQPYLLTK